MSWIEEWVRQGWTVRSDWWPREKTRELRRWAEEARAAGAFRPAGIGREAQQQSRIRGDEILWVPGPENQPPVLRETARAFEDLRQHMNRELYLGLDSFEWHLAVYPPGQRYEAHVDQARGTSILTGERVVSAVLYLNPDWTPEEEGHLVILDRQNPTRELEKVSPNEGTLVLFQSGSILHEVRAPRRERWSLTGWFRRR